jgi:hypothetical protein
MSAEETLHDVDIREQQLQEYILRSPEYLKRADRELKRQVTMLYLAITLLLVFQGFFTLKVLGVLPFSEMMLVSVTSILAIANCLLLIKTKTWLHRLNEAWLNPQERIAISSLRTQKQEILSRLATAPSEEAANAGLN